MDAGEFRASAHRVVDLIADYLDGRRALRRVPGRSSPGSCAASSTRRRPSGARGRRRDPRRHPAADPAERHALAAPGLLRVLRDIGVGDRHPRRDADRWASGPTRCCGGRRRSRRSSRASSSTGSARRSGCTEGFDGLITDTASTSSLIALAAAREAAGVDGIGHGWHVRPGAARLRIRRGALVHREGVHDARDRRATTSCACPSTTTTRCNRRSSRRPSPRTAPPDCGPIAVVATVGTTSSTSFDPVAAIADDRRARAPVAARRRRVRRRSRAAAGAARAVHGLGARGLHRRQPAQVVLRAAGRVAAAHAPHRRRARGVQPGSRSTCARSIARTPPATTTSSRRSWGGGSAP